MCMGIGWFLPQKDVQNVHFQQISTEHVQSTKSIQQKKKKLDTNYAYYYRVLPDS